MVCSDTLFPARLGKRFPASGRTATTVSAYARIGMGWTATDFVAASGWPTIDTDERCPGPLRRQEEPDRRASRGAWSTPSMPMTTLCSRGPLTLRGDAGGRAEADLPGFPRRQLGHRWRRTRRTDPRRRRRRCTSAVPPTSCSWPTASLQVLPAGDRQTTMLAQMIRAQRWRDRVLGTRRPYAQAAGIAGPLAHIRGDPHEHPAAPWAAWRTRYSPHADVSP